MFKASADSPRTSRTIDEIHNLVENSNQHPLDEGNQKSRCYLLPDLEMNFVLLMTER